MVSAVERREHIREVSNDRSSSPIRGRHSPRRRTSPRRERSPAPRKRSPRGRSPDRTYRARSPVKENVPGRARSSKHERQRSPVKASPSRSPSPRTKRLRRAQGEREFEKSAKHERQRSPVKASASRSPSPRTTRLRRAQAERESEKSADRDHGRSLGREDHDKGRHKERVEVKDVSRDRKSLRENNDGGSSKSSRHDHSDSPEGRSHKSRHSLRSPTRASKAGARNEVGTKAEPAEYSRDDENDDALAKMKAAEQALEAKEKQKPSFELSGKLAEETNKVRGVTLLFNEPPDARKPEVRWRLYVFKAGEVLNEPLYVHRQSCYLFGRERKVADIPTDHPSCSKQHAVIQYRLVEKEQPDGMMSKEVRPYVMDLGSTNGTYINDNRIEPQRYYELFEKDTIRFGNSSREYVLLHEKSAG